MLLAVVSGIGIAAYHPVAARLVNFAAGNRKSTAMSIFGVGGIGGFAIGPLLVTMPLLHWGMKGTFVLTLPVTIMSIVMMTQLSRFETLESDKLQKSSSGLEEAAEAWGAFLRLTITVIGRSIIFYGLNTFIPIYWINGLHQSKATGAMALTLFAGSGILGNLLGGTLADRIGQKKVVLIGFIGLTLLLPLLISTDYVFIATVLLIPIGLMQSATYSPTIVLGQTYLPNRVGFSSGVTLGVAFAIGGGAVPIIGKIADIYGVWYAMASVACMPVLTAAISLTLPEAKRIVEKKGSKEIFSDKA
jgi:FSR family fosmidomycin resistance protein-like MFS transporter